MTASEDDRRSIPPAGAGPAASRYAERVAVVVNGNAKRVDDELVGVLDQIVATGDLFVSRSLDEGRDIARTIVERGYPTVLTGGGDGTFTQTVTWIVAEAERLGVPTPRFGLLRLGTGNALAWVVGAEESRGRGIVPDLARLRDAGSRELRLLDVEGTLTMFAGLGIDALALSHFEQVKESFSKVPVVRRFATGGLAYVVAVVGRTMPEYVVRPHRQVKIVNEGAPAQILDWNGQVVREAATGETIFDGRTRMVCMSTIPYWGFGARIFPFAGERSDRFSLRSVDIENADVALHIRKIWAGTFRKDGVRDYLVEKVSLHYDEPMPLQIGGEYVGERSRVDVAMHPRPIRIVDHYAPPRV